MLELIDKEVEVIFGLRCSLADVSFRGTSDDTSDIVVALVAAADSDLPSSSWFHLMVS